MSVTDLTGTSWKFHNRPTLTPPFSYDLTFISNNFPDYYAVKILTGTTAGRPSLLFGRSNGSTGSMYLQAFNRWYAGYQIIHISGGVDATNPNLIAWIEANADLYISVYKVHHSEMEQTADAIRGKLGTSNKILWNDTTGFAEAVTSIYVGTDTRDATAKEWDVAFGKIAYANEAQIVGTMEDAEGVSF